MIWQQPWAWIGLATIALPILIHSLGQGRARRQRFPTLRFFGAVRPLPTQRTKIHDLLLLCVRVAILVAAVAALAQPLLQTANRKRAFDQSLARTVIVDTSASMLRANRGRAPAIETALREARLLTDSATAAIILRTATPASAIAGALAWLGRQGGRGEVVIVSDFQVGTLEQADVAAIPRDVGVRLIVVPTDSLQGLPAIPSRYGVREVIARPTLTADRTDVGWEASPAASARFREQITLLSGPTDEPELAAAEHAVAMIGLPIPEDSTRALAIVYPGYAGRSKLLRTAAPIHTGWMADAVARIHASGSVERWLTAPVALDSGRAAVVERDFSRNPLLLAATDSFNGRERLLLFWLGRNASTGLIAAATRALSPATNVAEFDPATIPEGVLEAWRRAPTDRTPAGTNHDDSDGRWFWVAVLALLAVESLLRRRPALTTLPVEATADTTG